MKIAIVFYSRTGNTETVVKIMERMFREVGIEVDVFRISPLKEYSRPLHINPRVIYDTLVRNGTTIRLVPTEFTLEKYNTIVVASPIWFNTLASPIQQFLKNYANKIGRLVILVTSSLSIDCKRIIHRIENLAKTRPSLCINITQSIVKNKVKLQEFVQEAVKEIIKQQQV